MSLRAWIVVIIAWGVVLAWVRSQGSLIYALVVASHSVIAWGVSFLTAFTVVRKFGPVTRGRGGRITVSVLLAIVLAVMIYLAWAQYRARYLFIISLHRGSPYPDPWIDALERWFDARRPGRLKYHGEYQNVAMVIGTLILIFASVTGFLLGLLWNRTEAVQGIERGCSDREAT